jgi:hypothetical protein
LLGGEDEVGEIKSISFICICCEIEIVEEMEGRRCNSVVEIKCRRGEDV